MDRERFLKIAAVLKTDPKRFNKIMKTLSEEDFHGYEVQRILWVEERELARKEGRLH